MPFSKTANDVGASSTPVVRCGGAWPAVKVDPEAEARWLRWYPKTHVTWGSLRSESGYRLGGKARSLLADCALLSDQCLDHDARYLAEVMEDWRAMAGPLQSVAELPSAMDCVYRRLADEIGLLGACA